MNYKQKAATTMNWQFDSGTLRALSSSGWRPSRKVDIQERVRNLTAAGFSFSIPAVKFLESFIDLSMIPQPVPYRNFKPHKFQVNPDGLIDYVDNFHHWSSMFGIKLSPLCEWSDYDAWGMNEVGEIYCIPMENWDDNDPDQDEWFRIAGNSVESVMRMALCGIGKPVRYKEFLEHKKH